MPENAISTMLAYLASNRTAKIGILSPRHILLTAPNAAQDLQRSNQEIDVLTTMTSGNLVNLKAYQDVGPFDDRLFIDVVDHDFNLRLKASGYRIIELTNLPLIHRLGTQKKVPLTRLTFVSHSPIRNYYLIRNSLLVARANSRFFPSYWLTAILTITIEIIKVALVENQRALRVKLAFQGLWHGLLGRSGKVSV
jgi:rhamnosyltransferase